MSAEITLPSSSPQRCTSRYFQERICCPVCGGGHRRQVLQLDYRDTEMVKYLSSFYSHRGGIEARFLEGASYTLVACGKCGLIYQQEVPGEELMLHIYEDGSSLEQKGPNDELGSLGGYYDYFIVLCARELFFVGRYFQRPPGSVKVLDFGMGWGHWCLLARAYGFDVSGLEFSPSRVAYAREGGTHVVQWEDLTELKFDYIHTEQVFEHLTNPLETLQALARCLRPGGLIKISVPDGTDILRRLKIGDWSASKGSPNSINAVAPLEHLNCFNRLSLAALGTTAGLVPVWDITRAGAGSLRDRLIRVLKAGLQR